MKTTGTGSKHSPIAIDDSEDEVLQELVGETSFDSNASSHHQLSMTDQRDEIFREMTTAGTNLGNYQHPGVEGKRPQKRKRATHDLHGSSVPGPSQQRHPLPSHPPPPLLSKKAKKRRRKLERQTIDAEAHPPKHQLWTNGANYSSPDLMPSPMLQSWPANGMGYKKPFSQPELAGPFSTYSVPTYAQHLHYNAGKPNTSSSAWVASMTMAAESPVQDGPAVWESYPFIPKWPDFLQASPPPPTQPARASHAPRPILQKPAAPSPLPAPLPTPAPVLPPTPVQSIGMKPDQDPSSKHGLYQIPPGATSSSKADTPYIPNPARTLVMEQLPKSHRTNDFINSWSKSACGAYPVYVSVDPPAAKALIEFATAELARKAWSSPRLGAALVGLKTHQLKGRSREDLIKAWWYRVDGVGANAGVGEIEEGEIEGDAAEKEVEVPVKKETKKERKARLARERQEKQKAFLNSNLTAPPTQAPSQATTAVPPPEISISRGPAAPSLLSLPSNPAIYSNTHTEHNFSFYPELPPALPPVLSHHHHPPVHTPAPPRAPLLPQSALATHWRPRHDLPPKPIQILPEPAAFQQALSQNGSIASSIASSRSPSPAQLSPHFIKPQDDMEIDDDMELESPQTGKRAHFDFSLPPPNYDSATVEASPVLAAPTPNVTAASSEDLSSVSSGSPVVNVGGATTTRAPTVYISEQSDSTVSPPASISTPDLYGTPPFEPRAMKNAPKGPSHAKRSLLARQKDLEGRIAHSKMELGLPTITSPVSTVDPSIPMTASPISGDNDSDKQAMEHRLRSLVLQSQRNKVKTSVSTTSSTGTSDASPVSPSSASPALSSRATAASPVPSSTVPSSTVSTVSSHSFSLDDLAISFITETIETFKATPAPPTPSVEPIPARTTVPVLPTRSNTNTNANIATKLELAAKQKRLEAQIAESKILMAKLAQARTKQERESILVVMRERSRVSEDDGTGTTPTSTTTTAQAQPKSASNSSNLKINAQAVQAHFAKKWPGSLEYAGVLIVSDDEEDDDSDGDDMA